MSNKLTRTAQELLAIEEHLSQYEHPDDFDLRTFDQTRGSTALGFGGVGGQAMTTARTYVFIPYCSGKPCYVYFGWRFAYKASYSSVFWNDVIAGRMASVMEMGKYQRAALEEENKNG